MQKENSIDVTCVAATTLPLDRLLDFQGGIKSISETNLAKLKRRILGHGINAPVFVWQTKAKNPKSYIIDGHQRCVALRELQDEGYEIPEIPVALIEAKSKKDAANKLLAITSQYGDFDAYYLEEFVLENAIEIDPLRLVGGDLNFTIGDEEKNAPEEFPEFGEDIETEYRCPSCGYEWSGNPK